MCRKIRSLAAILAITLLGAGAAQAWAPPERPLPAAHEEGGLLAALWDWLVSLAGGPEIRDEDESKPVRQKSGCGMDPDGSTSCK